MPLKSPPLSSQGSKGTKNDAELEIYLATVDLGRLGRNVKNDVKNGKIKNLYVLGYVPDKLMRDPGTEDLDIE